MLARLAFLVAVAGATYLATGGGRPDDQEPEPEPEPDPTPEPEPDPGVTTDELQELRDELQAEADRLREEIKLAGSDGDDDADELRAELAEVREQVEELRSGGEPAPEPKEQDDSTEET